MPTPSEVDALAAHLLRTADTVVATVNGQDITLGEMIVMKQTMQQDPQTANMPDQALWDMMLDQLIRQAAVAETGTESAGVRAQIELQKRNVLAAEAVGKIAEPQPGERPRQPPPQLELERRDIILRRSLLLW